VSREQVDAVKTQAIRFVMIDGARLISTVSRQLGSSCLDSLSNCGRWKEGEDVPETRVINRKSCKYFSVKQK
jgi:hypothetical protein